MIYKNKYYLSFILTFVLTFALNFTNVFAESNLKVHFIDVGQADSILIQAPNGKNMLIDAGETKEKAVINYLNNLGIKKLDVIVATHPHSDHISEMADVINNFEVGSFYMPKVSHTTQTFSNMAAAVKNKGLKALEAKSGEWIPLDENLTCDIIAPCSNEYESLNDWSAVIHLGYGNTSFLFTGDAEALSENEIIKSEANIQSTVLKVGHHGSSSSTTTNFLKAVNPKYAVIEVGQDNDYGHPHKETIEKLSGITTYQTAKDGNILFTTDGNKVTVETNFLPSKPINNNQTSSGNNNSGVTAPNNSVAPSYDVDNQDTTVYVTKTGSKYHTSGCRYLKKSKIPISLLEAISSYSPCSVCNPPR